MSLGISTVNPLLQQQLLQIQQLQQVYQQHPPLTLDLRKQKLAEYHHIMISIDSALPSASILFNKYLLEDICTVYEQGIKFFVESEMGTDLLSLFYVAELQFNKSMMILLSYMLFPSAFSAEQRLPTLQKAQNDYIKAAQYYEKVRVLLQTQLIDIQLQPFIISRLLHALKLIKQLKNVFIDLLNTETQRQPAAAKSEPLAAPATTLNNNTGSSSSSSSSSSTRHLSLGFRALTPLDTTPVAAAPTPPSSLASTLAAASRQPAPALTKSPQNDKQEERKQKKRNNKKGKKSEYSIDPSYGAPTSKHDARRMITRSVAAVSAAPAAPLPSAAAAAQRAPAAKNATLAITSSVNNGSSTNSSSISATKRKHIDVIDLTKNDNVSVVSKKTRTATIAAASTSTSSSSSSSSNSSSNASSAAFIAAAAAGHLILTARPNLATTVVTTASTSTATSSRAPIPGL